MEKREAQGKPLEFRSRLEDNNNCNPKELAHVVRAFVLAAFPLGLRFKSP
jgi:hypothetical protein